jgi:hypothetical protein
MWSHIRLLRMLTNSKQSAFSKDGITMKDRATSKSVARAAVVGGMMAAGACALISAAPAQATPAPPLKGPANGNPTTPPKLVGFSGIVPVWATGTYNTAICGNGKNGAPSGACFVPDATTPFPIGSTPSSSEPIVSNSSGTSTTIGLGY